MRNATSRSLKNRFKIVIRKHQPLLILVFCILAVLAAELVLRSRPLPAYIRELIFLQAADIEVHTPSKDLNALYELKPDSEMKVVKHGILYRKVTINSMGLRDPERELKKGKDVYRIIILGSSATFGATVSDNETMTVQMEKYLNETAGRWRYEVWNAGVNAYNPTQMIAQARRLIKMGVEPDVMLFQMHLFGPRAFLSGDLDIKAFETDPSLFEEHFLMPFGLTREFGADIATKYRLAFLLIAHYNRMVGAEKRMELLIDKQMEHHKSAIKNFTNDFSDKIKIAAINLPCLEQDDNFSFDQNVTPSGMQSWCVKILNGAAADYNLHPTGKSYLNWAKSLVAAMTEHEFLTEK